MTYKQKYKLFKEYLKFTGINEWLGLNSEIKESAWMNGFRRNIMNQIKHTKIEEYSEKFTVFTEFILCATIGFLSWFITLLLILSFFNII